MICSTDLKNSQSLKQDYFQVGQNNFPNKTPFCLTLVEYDIHSSLKCLP